MTDTETLKSELVRVVADATGASVTIDHAVPLAGGASMETWAVDMNVGGERFPLVLRRDMGSNMYAGALSRAEEFELLRLAHANGVRAPRPRWLHTASERPFFLMDRLGGEGVGRKVVRAPELADARAGLAAQMGEQLARIHAISLVELPKSLRRPEATETGAEVALREIRRTVDALGPRPVWEYGLRWLAHRMPRPSGPPTLIHGDFRIGNLLVTPQGLSGVLDWEFAHIGDPLEDLAWPLIRAWRFDNDALHVGGVGKLEDYLEAYEAAGGRHVERTALAWWEVLGNLRWAVFSHAQAARHLNGQDRSIELASLGRKAAEVEWELLDLVKRQGERR